MKLKSLIILFIASVIFNHSFGQHYKVCGNFEAEQKLANDPEVIKRRAALKAFTQTYINNIKSAGAKVATPIYTIPVVFHIMHDYGTENISRSQVLDAVRIINEDFQNLNADRSEVAQVFVPIMADCQIEFKLAQLDPSGNCTDGITRHPTKLTYGANDNVKNIVQWDPSMYLNIWIVKSISFGAAGYAYLPGAPNWIDGIVILHDYVGSIGSSNGNNYNRHSLSHEIGHYFNLYHTWGTTNNPGLPSNCNDDDDVFDTPNTIGVANFSCDTNQSTCAPGVIDNVQNFMDYAACHNMFTIGQSDRMHATLNSNISNRDNLWSSSNLIATGTNAGYNAQVCSPVADFSDRVKYLCEGSNTVFRDASWGGTGYTYQWTFNGGTPAFSNDSVVSVTYNSSGTYDVTLAVTSAAGTSTITRSQFVHVSAVTNGTAIPYSQGFESFSLPAFNWFVENEDGNNTWQINNAVSYSGSKSIWLNNFINNASQTTDAFITEPIDFSNLYNGILKFKMAYADKQTTDNSLKIYTSSNCGNVWVLRYNKAGTSLSTVSPKFNSFTPTSLNQWKEETLSVPYLGGKQSVRFKFEFTNNNGNNLYIDDINIASITAVNDLSGIAIDLSVSPNPVADKTVVSLNLSKNEFVTISLFDLLGNQVKKIVDAKLMAGENTIQIQNSFAPGVYLLKVKTEEATYLQKIIFN